MTDRSSADIEAVMLAGFTDLDDEVDVELAVDGEIPQWLAGSFVRNGPAHWMVEGGRLNHWFDGAAMLHRFGISSGRVQYRNRFLQSKNYRALKKTGQNKYGQFGTDPKRSWFAKLLDTVDFTLQFGDNDLVTVAEIGSQWMAVGETPTNLGIDVNTVETTGTFKFKGRMMSMWTCSHMITDVAKNRVYSYSVLAMPFLARYHLWYVDGDTHRRTKFATIKDKKPSYMHSFGMTDDYVIFTRFPFRLNVWGMFANAFTGTPFIRNYRWDGTESTKCFIVDKHSGEMVTEFELPTMFAFHFANAWQDGNDVVFEIAAYDDAEVLLTTTWFFHLLGPDGGHFPRSELRRYRVPLDGSSPPLITTISDAAIEMPKFNDRYQGRTSRYVYGQTFDEVGQFYDGLVKIDSADRIPNANPLVWRSPRCWPSEPVFVERPGATEEDDGVLLSVVLDMTGEDPSSFLLVLDASTFLELARATTPVTIPFGLHGAFAAEQETT